MYSLRSFVESFVSALPGIALLSAFINGTMGNETIAEVPEYTMANLMGEVEHSQEKLEFVGELLHGLVQLVGDGIEVQITAFWTMASLELGVLILLLGQMEVARGRPFVSIQNTSLVSLVVILSSFSVFLV